MAQQIVYCDRCSRMISPADMLKGKALVTAGATICVECAAALSDEERARLSPPRTADDEPAQAERQPRHSSSIRRLPEQPPDSSRQRVLLGIVGGLAGILAGIAAAVVVVRGGRVPEVKPMPSPSGVQLLASDITDPTPTPVVESKAVEAPAENPAGKRLEEIRSWVEPMLKKYVDTRKALVEFPSSFPDSPESEAAKSLLEELDASYAKLASASLQKALASTDALVSARKYREAILAIEAIRVECGAGVWLVESGERDVKAALVQVRGEIERAVRSAIDQARAAFEDEDLASASEALSDRVGWPKKLDDEAAALEAVIERRKGTLRAEKMQAEAWKDFLLGFVAAGEKGVGEAKAYFDGKRAELSKEKRSAELDHFAQYLRDAVLTESLAEDGFRFERGLVRVKHGDTPISGKVLSVEKGILVLKPPLGEQIEMSFAELAAEDIVDAAGFTRGATKDPVRTATYFLVRGRLASARSLVVDLQVEAAEVLLSDIETLMESLRAAPTAVAAEEAARGDSATEGKPKGAEPSDTGVPQTEVSEGLVGYWKFDESEGVAVRDSSGNDNHGTLKQKGTHGAHTWLPEGGCEGGALKLDYYDRPDNNVTEGFYVDIPSAPRCTQHAGFSLSLWVRPKRWGDYGFYWPAFIRKQGQYHLGSHEVGKLSFAVAVGGAPVEIMCGAPSVDVWHHIAGVYDGSALKIYVDGAEVVSKGATGEVGSAPGPLHLGARLQNEDKFYDGLIDEVRIYERALSVQEIARLALKEIPQIRLNPGSFVGLRKTLKETSATRRKLIAVGGAVSAYQFGVVLAKELPEGDGYQVVSKGSLTAKGVSASSVLKGIPSLLRRETPELVFVCFDPAVLAKGHTPAQIVEQMGSIADAILSGGAIPVFGTMPMYKPADESAWKLVESYNAMVLGLSETKSVPVIDMFSLLNDDAEMLPRLFTPRGGLKAAAYQSMASTLAAAYRQLERYVMARRVESVPIRREAVADGAIDGAADVPIETSRLGPNLIANGGFEELSADGRSSARWRFHNWGKDDARWNARLDRVNSHSGARSLQVLASSQEAQPGAFTSFSAEAGTYEVSFWACADTGGGVSVRAHLAGTDTAPLTAGEEWKRLSALVEVKERQANASLKLWISTHGVRVWLDDVEVRRLGD